MEHRLDPSRFAVSRNVPGLSVHYFSYTSLVTPPKRSLEMRSVTGPVTGRNEARALLLRKNGQRAEEDPEDLEQGLTGLLNME